MSQLLEHMQERAEDPTQVVALKEWQNEQGVFGVYDMGREFTMMGILFVNGSFWHSMMYSSLKEQTVKDATAIARFAGLEA